MFCPFTILIREAVWGQTGKTFFSEEGYVEEGYVAYHIMQLKCLTLCNPPGLQIRVRIGKLVSLFLIQNICCGYSKEPSQ